MKISNNDFLALTLSQPDNLSAGSFSFASGTAHIENSGILRLEPRQSAKVSLVISVGIHGNETAPIELGNQWLKDILDGKTHLHVRLLFIIGHPQAILKQTRFCDVNLNRLFNGAWQRYEGMEVARAQQLERAVADFFASAPGHQKLHYDLHTAIRGSQYEKFAVHPFTDGSPYCEQQFAFLAASGIEAVLLSHQPTTTFSYHSYDSHGAQAFTIELGKVQPFGRNDLSRLAKLDHAMRGLLATGKMRCARQDQLKVFQVVDVVNKDAEDFQLAINTDVKNFTPFNRGYQLASSSKSEYLVKADGDAIVFPNSQLPVGQRAGLVVRPTAWGALDKV